MTDSEDKNRYEGARPIYVLLLEDDAADADAFSKLLKKSPLGRFEVKHCENLKDALNGIRAKETFDIIVTDLNLPDAKELETVKILLHQAPDLPLVVLTGTYDNETWARTAVAMGVQDYLVKDQLSGGMLDRSLLYAIERKKLAGKELTLKMMEEMTSTISHEIRTPLTAIQEGISLICDELPIPMTAMDKNNIVRVIQLNVLRLTRLVNNTIEFQRSKLASYKLNTQLEDINTLVTDAVKTFMPMARRKGFRMELRCPEGLPLVACDRDKITQVMDNLIANAIQFSSDGGVVIITTAKDRDWVRVAVSNMGQSIKKEDQELLFKDYSRISNGQQKRTHGFGLGLAISKRIIDAHHGQIGVDSDGTQGTTFFFILPFGTVIPAKAGIQSGFPPRRAQGRWKPQRGVTPPTRE